MPKPKTKPSAQIMQNFATFIARIRDSEESFSEVIRIGQTMWKFHAYPSEQQEGWTIRIIRKDIEEP